MKIYDITVGSRARASMGWLDDLERSIEQMGVLQPIGVTPEGELVFGQRRLQACKNLGMEEIPARVIDINPGDPAHLLKMEQAENNVRKDFTPSEKVEIARRIEEALAGRVGVNQHSKRVDKDLPTHCGRSLSASSRRAPPACSEEPIGSVPSLPPSAVLQHINHDNPPHLLQTPATLSRWSRQHHGRRWYWQYGCRALANR